MSHNFTLTVRDVLKRPLFKNARLRAGQAGLDNTIRWVHILQGSHVENLLSGNEMILTTGARLKSGNEIEFIQELITQGVSCLFIELGDHIKEVTKEMIRISNNNQFPLIVFDDSVRFIDLTQDINSILVNQHIDMMNNFVKNSRQFHVLTLSLHATSQIVRLLHVNSQADVVFLAKDGESIFMPPVDPKEEERLKTFISSNATFTFSEKNLHKTWKQNNHHYILHPVGASGQTWGYLLMILEGRQPEELDYLMLDSASISIAQDLLRNWYLDEKQAHAEHVWVADYIHGYIHKQEELNNWLPSKFYTQKKLYFVCVFEITNLHEKSSKESTLTHLMLLIRKEFTSIGFHPLMTSKQDLIVTVIVIAESTLKPKEKIQKVFNSITAPINTTTQITNIRLGTGRIYNDLNEIQKSYQEAMYVLKINQSFLQQTTPFYEDLGIYRILVSLINEYDLNSFVKDTIGSLLKHDQIHQSNLIKTLRVLLEQDGSKQEAAKKLYIARQTMYYRLNKIKELLGDDFMKAEKRLSIEVALRALDILDNPHTLVNN